VSFYSGYFWGFQHFKNYHGYTIERVVCFFWKMWQGCCIHVKDECVNLNTLTTIETKRLFSKIRVITGLRCCQLGIENLNKLVIITNNWPNDRRYYYSNEILFKSMEEFVNVVITQLTYLSLGLAFCVFITIFKLINFVVGYLSLSFYCHFETQHVIFGVVCVMFLYCTYLLDFVLGHMFLNFCCVTFFVVFENV
jgi:hypothetical protein